VGPEDTEVRGKILSPLPRIESGRPARSQTLYRLSYPGSSPYIIASEKSFIRVRSTGDYITVILYSRLCPGNDTFHSINMRTAGPDRDMWAPQAG
jgi:hypothetical protein